MRRLTIEWGGEEVVVRLSDYEALWAAYQGHLAVGDARRNRDEN